MNVFCVLRAGGDYGPTHVERLQRQLALHLPHAELVCLSDVEVPSKRIPLRQSWPGWWAKMELFAPWVKGDILFFDLDTSLVGDLSDIAAVRPLTLLQDFYFPQHVSTGMMFLPIAVRPAIWKVFSRDPQRWMQQYSGATAGGARWGDQGFLSAHGLGSAQRWQSVVPGQVYSYKAHCRGEASLPTNPRVICFHGQPRPWDPSVPAAFAGA